MTERDDAIPETSSGRSAPASEAAGVFSLRVRRVTAAFLVVLAALSLFGAVVGLWANRTLLQTENFTDLVLPAVLDPEVKAAYAARAGDELVDALAIEDRLRTRLGNLDQYLSETIADALNIGDAGQALLGRLDLPTLSALAQPIADGINDRIRTVVVDVVDSDEYDRLMTAAIPAAHERAVALIRGDLEDLPNVVVDTGEVRLNTVPVLAEVLRRVVQSGIDLVGLSIDVPEFSSTEDAQAATERLAGILGVDLPPDFGQVTIMTEARLEELQRAVRILDAWVWGLVILTIVLTVAAVVVAPNRRRTIAQLAGASVLVLLLAWLVESRAERWMAERITTGEGRAALGQILGRILDNLGAWLVVVAIVALLVGLLAIIIGQTDRIRAGWERGQQALSGEDGESEAGRFIRRRYDILRIVGAVVAFVALLLWGISWVSVIVIGALLVVYLWGLSLLRSPVTQEEMASTRADD